MSITRSTGPIRTVTVTKMRGAVLPVLERTVPQRAIGACTVTRRSLRERCSRTSNETVPRSISRRFSTCRALDRAPVSIFARNPAICDAKFRNVDVLGQTDDQSFGAGRPQGQPKLHRNAPPRPKSSTNAGTFGNRDEAVSDEFPTLEVALAASVAVLVWRGLLLHRSRIGFLSSSERLLQTFQHGPPSARELSAAQLGPLLEPLARAALTAQVEDTPRAVTERTSRIRRRVRSAAARDLVICAVLGGSLLYAFSSEMVAGWVFYALGALATLLLLLAVFERVQLDRALARIGQRFGTAVSAFSPDVSGRELHELRACRVCGTPYRERLTGSADLGPRLWALGTSEHLACGRCGHVTGKIVVRAQE
jgi:hypothetical protein